MRFLFDQDALGFLLLIIPYKKIAKIKTMRPVILTIAFHLGLAVSDARRLGTPTLAPGMGASNPIGVPSTVQCPFDEVGALETKCASDNVGLCFYEYHYTGCDYDELDCVQAYTCECQSHFTDTRDSWRC